MKGWTTAASHWSLLIALSGSLAACSSTEDAWDFAEKLTIAMVGVFEQPEDAVGNSDPKFVNVILEDVRFTREDGTIVDLFEGDPASFRIINRTQIIHEVNMADYVNETLSGLTVEFDPVIGAQHKSGSTLSSSLMFPSVSPRQALKVEKAVQKRLTIRLLWKNTITYDPNTDPPSEVFGNPSLQAVFSDE